MVVVMQKRGFRNTTNNNIYVYENILQNQFALCQYGWKHLSPLPSVEFRIVSKFLYCIVVEDKTYERVSSIYPIHSNR